MTAIETLPAILDAGGKVVPGPERPRRLSLAARRPLVEAHPEGLRALLLAYGPHPFDIFRRAKAFRRQVDDCGARSWERYGRHVLCLQCAQARERGAHVHVGVARS